jgi:hypothetical protein
MSYHVRIKGLEIECDTVLEVAALTNELGDQPAKTEPVQILNTIPAPPAVVPEDPVRFYR